MKFYITGRSSNYEQVQETFRRLKRLGHEITFEWTELPMVKPYDEHPEEAARFAEQGIQGVIDADVYIKFSHPDGNGVFTEFGAALAVTMLKGTLKIFAIGEHQSAAMFNYHPAVQWCESLEEVLQKLGIKSD